MKQQDRRRGRRILIGVLCTLVGLSLLGIAVSVGFRNVFRRPQGTCVSTSTCYTNDGEHVDCTAADVFGDALAIYTLVCNCTWVVEAPFPPPELVLTAPTLVMPFQRRQCRFGCPIIPLHPENTIVGGLRLNAWHSQIQAYTAYGNVNETVERTWFLPVLTISCAILGLSVLSLLCLAFYRPRSPRIIRKPMTAVPSVMCNHKLDFDICKACLEESPKIHEIIKLFPLELPFVRNGRLYETPESIRYFSCSRCKQEFTSLS